jgi:xanthine dehydrogenase accessory factor
VNDVLEQLRAWAGEDRAAAMATVVDVRRSAPRPPGAKMAVGPGGAVVGAVSGGCVEAQVVMAAELVLADGRPRLLHLGIADADAWSVGLPCGGEIDVWVEPFERGGPLAAFAELAALSRRAAVVTIVDAPVRVGARMLVDDGGATRGSLGDPLLDHAARTHADELMWAERSEVRQEGETLLFVDVIHPPPRLFIFGAVDFAAELCTLARVSGWLPYVIDPRGRFATRERFPDAVEVVTAWPGEAIQRLGGIDRATSIAVLTHDPKLDDAALEIALRSDAGYVGAMGSRRAQAERRERLAERGLGPEHLDRLAAPIGLDLGALTPQETALSIMAEVVAVRRGHPGGRLQSAAGRIHEVGARPSQPISTKGVDDGPRVPH